MMLKKNGRLSNTKLQKRVRDYKMNQFFGLFEFVFNLVYPKINFISPMNYYDNKNNTCHTMLF